MRSTDAGWLPVEALPVGLITWYLPDGQAAARAVSWLAVVNGQPPELRAGWPRLADGVAGLPEGADFAINIPAAPTLSPLRDLLSAAVMSAPVTIDNGLGITPARTVRAPLLEGCALQLECAAGRVLPGGWETALAGEVSLLRRGGLLLDPAGYADFSALRPLHAIFPS